MTSVIILNEFNLVRFLVLLLTGRQPYVVDVDPLFPPSRRVLQWVLNRARRSGRVRDILDLCPEVAHVQLRWSQVYLLNVLGKIEGWQNQRFGFAALDALVPDYARAIKATVVNYLRLHYPTIVPLAIALPKLEAAGGVRVYGALPSTIEAAEAYGKVRLAHLAAPSPTWLFPVVNTVMAVVCALYGLGWLVSRLRRSVATEQVWLMADYTGDPRDYGICEELRDGGPIMLHVREMSGLDVEKRNFHRYPHCRPLDGLVTPGTAPRLAAMVVLDVAKLCRHFLGEEPGLFFRYGVMPFKRATVQALIARYRPRYFLGRDEDSVEHILRSVDLRHAGIASIGILHGLPHYSTLRATFRYITFERFYVFGRAIAQYYKTTWDQNMHLVFAGTYGVPRDAYAHIGQPRPGDISVFAAVATGNPRLTAFVRRLAEAFPERTVFLKLKPNYARMDIGRRFVADCTDGLANVQVSDQLVPLLRDTTYAFADASTVLAEAVQFGLCAFMADVIEGHEDCFYRDFPGLTLGTPEQAISRIKAIEDGSWRYPRDEYRDLIDLSGAVFFDVLRRDLGLEPKAPLPEGIEEVLVRDL